MMLDAKTLKLVLDFFNGDGEKARTWMNTKNLNLGDVSPIEMMARGRTEKLKKWIITSLEEHNETT